MLILLIAKIKETVRKVFVLKLENMLRVTSYFFVIGCFLLGGGFVFYRIFNYLKTVEIIGGVLEKRIISLAFLIFLVMIFLSSIITALTTFFRSKEIPFLMSLPIQIEKIFVSKLVENSFYCSWATLVAAIPITWAFGLSHNYSFCFYPLSLVALLMFILIPSALGVSILILLINIVGNISKRRLVYIMIVFLCLLIVLFFVTKPNIFQVPFTEDINEINRYIENLKIESKYLPSDHLVKFILHPFKSESNRFLLLLISSSIFSVMVAYGVSLGLYRKAWNKAFESSSGGEKNKFTNTLFSFLIRFGFPQRMTSLIVKDIRMFTRLPSQWGQALIFVVLLFIYTISIKRTPYYFNSPAWLAVISFLNLVFTGYVIATLSTRFVYPSISLEGETMGLLLSSPTKIKELLTEKFIAGLIPNLLLAEFIIVTSNILLKSPLLFTLISAGVTMVYTVTIVSISIGLGALFPDFSETNPSKIAAGGGGILTAILSLFYIALSTVIVAIPTRAFVTMQFRRQMFSLNDFYIYIIIFILISLIFSVFSLLAGRKRLERIEI
jgi:ABC-2 type transport system permease protein